MATVGKLNVILGAKVGKFLAGMRKVDQSIQKITNNAKFQGALALGFAGITAAVTKSVGAFASFERQAVRVAAITGDLQKFGDVAVRGVSDEIINLSKTTEFTASQVGEAFGFMAQAGLEMNQIVAAAPGVLQLASAAMIDVASAADIATNVLAGFGLEVGELGRVNDVLIKTATSSNTSVTQLGNAMKFVGPVAQSAGLEIEEVAAAIGILGNAGLQGEMGGTALRGAIAKLVAPSKDATKILKRMGVSSTELAKGFREPGGLAKMLEKLGPLAGRTGDIFKIFGQRAGPGVAVLLKRGADGLRDFTDEIRQAAGTAKEIADAQLKTLDGRIKILKSNFEAAAISIGKSFVPAIESLIANLTPAIQKLGQFFEFLTFTEDLSKPIDQINDKIATQKNVIDALKGKLDGLKSFADFDAGSKRAKNLANAIKKANKALAGMAKSGIGVVDALSKPGAVDGLNDGLDDAVDKAKSLFAELKKIAEKSKIGLAVSREKGVARSVVQQVAGFESQSAGIRKKAGGGAARLELAATAIGNFEEATINNIKSTLLGARSSDGLTRAMDILKGTVFDLAGDFDLLVKLGELKRKEVTPLEGDLGSFDFFGSSVDKMKKFNVGLKESAKHAVKSSKDVEVLGNAAREAASSLGDKFTTSLRGPGLLEGLIPKGGEDIIGAAVDSAITGNASGLVNTIGSSLGSVIGGAAGAIGSTIGGAVGGPIASGIVSAVTGAVTSIFEGLSTALSTITSDFFDDSRLKKAQQFGSALAATIVPMGLLVILGLAAGGVAAPLVLLAAAVAMLLLPFAALVGFAILFSQESDKFQRTQKGFSKAVDAFIAPFDSMAFQFIALVPLAIALGQSFGELMAIFGGPVPQALFEALKIFTLAALGAIIGVEGLRLSFVNFGASMETGLNNFLIAMLTIPQQIVAGFRELFKALKLDTTGFDAVGDTIDGMIAQLASRVDQLGGSFESDLLDVVGAAFRGVQDRDFFDSLREGLDQTREPFEGAANAADGMRESLLNVPSGFKVSLARFRSIIPGLGTADVPGGSTASGGATYNIDLVVIEEATDLANLSEQLQDQTLGQTGGLSGSQFPSGGGL